MKRYFKNTNTGRVAMSEMLLSDYPDCYEEITLGEFQAINKALQKERKKIDYSKGIVPPDGYAPYADMDKYYLYCQRAHIYISAPNLFGSAQDVEDSDGLADIEDIKEIISSGEEVQPVEAYYNSALDMYLCSDGRHRSRAFYDLKKDIPYAETSPGVKIITTDPFVSQYRDELELINMDLSDDTTITNSQYKALIILRNDWRKELI